MEKINAPTSGEVFKLATEAVIALALLAVLMCMAGHEFHVLPSKSWTGNPVRIGLAGFFVIGMVGCVQALTRDIVTIAQARGRCKMVWARVFSVGVLSYALAHMYGVAVGDFVQMVNLQFADADDVSLKGSLKSVLGLLMWMGVFVNTGSVMLGLVDGVIDMFTQWERKRERHQQREVPASAASPIAQNGE